MIDNEDERLAMTRAAEQEAMRLTIDPTDEQSSLDTPTSASSSCYSFNIGDEINLAE